MGRSGFGQDKVNFSTVREWSLEPSPGLVQVIMLYHPQGWESRAPAWEKRGVASGWGKAWQEGEAHPPLFIVPQDEHFACESPSFYNSVINIVAVTVSFSYLIYVSSKLLLSQPVISAFCGMREGDQFMVLGFLIQSAKLGITILKPG